MLRPSSLLSGTGSTSSSTPTTPTSAPKSFLRPATFQVGSTTDDSAASDSASEATPPVGESSSHLAASSSTPSSVANNPFLSLINQKEDDHPEADNEAKPKTTENGKQTTNGLPKAANLFKTANPTIPTTTTTSDFVFGQNVHERVTGESIQESSFSSSSLASSSATSSQLFAIAGSSANQPDSAGTPAVEASVENLTEVARVYEESRAQKRKYEEVKTFTGEENETNLLDISSKLFTFVAGQWEERGPGNLRVNDNKDRKKNSRVVFRTLGNLRVLINTKIWPGMVVERPSQKSLRFSAIDTDGQIKIYLAMARPEDVSSLFNQLTRRIKAEKCRAEAEEAEAASKIADNAESATSTSPSSAITSNTPTIEVTTVVDEDSGEVEEVSSPKRPALDKSVTTPDQKPDTTDDGVDTTTTNVD